MADIDRYKKLVQNEIDSLSSRLIEISDWICNNPEYGCEEFKAADLLSTELAKRGFHVEKPFLEMPTAFKATRKGKGSCPRVAILGEYDALEGVGHGCGHNMIGTAAVGAGIALAKIMDNLNGEIVVLGCPAEEDRKGGPEGGWPCQYSKELMCNRGVFDDIDAAIMIHPTTGLTQVATGTLISQFVETIFKGRSAHAAADPWSGRNALQAAVLFISGLNAMRQQFRRGMPYSPVSHWIITEGGTAGNVIPDLARCYGGCRSPDKEYLEELIEMTRNCAKGAALMTGCEVEFIFRRRSQMDSKRPNLYLTELLYRNLLQLGVETEDWRLTVRREPSGGTDFANVTRVIPGVDVMISVGKEQLPGHSTTLARATMNEEGHRALINGTKVLAMTATDILMDPSHVGKMKSVHLMQIDEYLKKMG